MPRERSQGSPRRRGLSLASALGPICLLLHERPLSRGAIALCPKPAICGKMNHIQWLRFRPLRSSDITWAYAGAWAAGIRLTPEGMLVLPNRLTVRKCTRESRGIPSESTANATSPFRIADFRFCDRSRRPIEDPVLDVGRRSKGRGGVKAPIPDASGADL